MQQLERAVELATEQFDGGVADFNRVFETQTALVNAEAEYVARDHIGRPYPTVHVRLDPDEGLTAQQLLDRLLAGNPPVAGMTGPDEWTIRLDVRELDDRQVQRVADAVLGVLMPGDGR